RPNEPPRIENQRFSIQEDASAGTVFGRVRASDNNAGQELTFSIVGGSGSSTFAVDPLTGEISVLNPLDFETKSRYEILVAVTDNGLPNLSSTATILINVTDVEESIEEDLSGLNYTQFHSLTAV